MAIVASTTDYRPAAEGQPDGDGSSEVIYSCQRTDTRYYTYGGARIAELNAALTRLGWHDFTYSLDETPLPEVSARPGTLAGSIGKIGLEYSWAVHGSRIVPDDELGAVPKTLPVWRNYYLQVIRPSTSSVLAHLTAANNQVLIISLIEYYAQSVP